MKKYDFSSLKYSIFFVKLLQGGENVSKFKNKTLKYLFSHALSRELFKEKIYEKLGVDLSKYILLTKDNDAKNDENYKLNIVLLNKNNIVVLCENNIKNKRIAKEYTTRIKENGISIKNDYIKNPKSTTLVFSR